MMISRELFLLRIEYNKQSYLNMTKKVRLWEMGSLSKTAKHMYQVYLTYFVTSDRMF